MKLRPVSNALASGLMNEISVEERTRAGFSGWKVGLLLLEGLKPREDSEVLDFEAERIEAKLKREFGNLGRKDIAGLEPARGYDEYFSRWGKAYPVVLQAEAVAAKGRKIAMADPLVRAMFAAELESMLLTAGHDLDALRGELRLKLASGAESLPTLGGSEKFPPSGDLMLKDEEGIVASVLLGPDSRTSIGPGTDRALFVIYSPPSVPVSAVRNHMDRLAELVSCACSGARGEDAGLLEL